METRERAERGRAARRATPRSSHAGWEAPPDRPDPVALLEEQAANRVQELVPIRYGRMLVSPFTFYRGAAYIMASDLAATPRSGIKVQACGDAHLSNFGGFASPERDLLFDINDFDETLPGPWEWDLKRLAASITVAGRENGFSAEQCRAAVLATVGEYREVMRRFGGMRNLDVWYARLDTGSFLPELERAGANAQQLRRFKKNVAKARAKDSMRAFNKLTARVDGELRIISDPPLIVTAQELLPDAERQEIEERVGEVLRAYQRSLPGDRRHLFEGFRLVDLARKVVGVGSVGTRAWIALFAGRDEQDPLFLQAKEAQASVLEPFLGKSKFKNCGQRVVEGQRLMQAASDILLGWSPATGIDGRKRDFYIRQLWDWKVSAQVEIMPPEGMTIYGRACGWTLARAHARSGDRIAIAAYLGKGDRFDQAIADFSEAYADQNERDYEALAAAVKSGRVMAEAGV